MNTRIFLDTCIFFEIHENDRTYHSFTHLKNKDYFLTTSLTVIGELIQELSPKPEKSAYLHTLWGFVEDVDFSLLVPNSRVSYACYLLCKYNEDERMKAEYTDLVHLAYAIAYKVPIFITTDRHLSHFRIPYKMVEKGFQQPIIKDIETMEKEILNKKG